MLRSFLLTPGHALEVREGPASFGPTPRSRNTKPIGVMRNTSLTGARHRQALHCRRWEASYSCVERPRRFGQAFGAVRRALIPSGAQMRSISAPLAHRSDHPARLSARNHKATFRRVRLICPRSGDHRAAPPGLFNSLAGLGIVFASCARLVSLARARSSLAAASSSRLTCLRNPRRSRCRRHLLPTISVGDAPVPSAWCRQA